MSKYKSFTAIGIKSYYYVIQKYHWIFGWEDFYITYDKKAFKKNVNNLKQCGKVVIEE